jgi:phosphotriesterase-related protein
MGIDERGNKLTENTIKQQELAGKVQTVLGIIDADSLGMTLVHEHLLHDMTIFFIEPPEAGERGLAYEPVQMDNLYWVRHHEINNLDNVKLTDEKLAIKEAMLCKLAGVDTIVELTTRGTFGRDHLGLARIARATGLNVIMGTGHCVAVSHPPQLVSQTEEEIIEEVVKDIMVGVGNTGIRAGIIGEIGCSLPLQDSELKVLRCCATAQQQTGAALSIHPSPSDDLVLEIIKILGKAGADLSRTIIGHVDLMGYSIATCRSILDSGCYIAYDNFGNEGLFRHPGLERSVELSDLIRINDIIKLIEDGYLNQILVSHDIAIKHRLVSYGGHGYAHILRDIVPVMRDKGMSNEQINTLLADNPKRILSFAPAKRKRQRLEQLT